MYEEMEHLTTQSEDQGISFPNEDEGGTKESANVQALNAEAACQLDLPQTESTITVRHAVRENRRRRAEAIGRDRQKIRLL